MRKKHKIPNHIKAWVVNGFGGVEEGGNPAGVVLDADGFSEDEMLAIAREIGMSETAFVSESRLEGFKLDFFTPNRRIAHCGHATIATFSFLASLGRVAEGQTSKETVDGPRKILIRNGEAYMEQTAPTYRSLAGLSKDGVSLKEILASLSVPEADLDPRVAPMVVNTGNRFLVIGVRDGDALTRLQPDFDRISDISDRLDLIGFYVFTTAPEATARDATTRMFAPRYAIEEEAATGMAAGPLACILHDYLGIDKPTLVIEQGVYMTPPSPSLINVELDIRDGQIAGLMAGGKGRMVREITVTLPLESSAISA